MDGPSEAIAAWVAGFIAAEGTLIAHHQKRSGRVKFVFAIELGAVDALACDVVAGYFACGHVRPHQRRQAHHDDTVRFQVTRLADLVERIVPFLDEHLPPSYKRRQFEAWRDELLDYWEHHARRRRS